MVTSKLELKDGRLLAYTQFGDLKGMPVFFFHGTPGSRFFHPPNEISIKHGARIITVDRPGYGESTFQPKREILDWPKDILQLADHLGFEKFSVTGHSGGGPYVFACTQSLKDRVTSSATISGTGPLEAVTAISNISTVNRIGFQFGRYIPWLLWKIIINLIFHQRSQDPWKDIDKQTANRPLADSHLMKNPEIRSNCFLSEVEAFKPGLIGFAWDARLLTRPWGVNLDEIKVPVTIWHGMEDNQAPISMAQYLANKVPSCTARFIQGEAHLMLFNFWEEILIGLIKPPK